MAKQVSPGVLALRKVVDDVYADAREAKKQGKLVGWSSSKFPCELAEAFDLNVMYPENQAAGIAAQRDGEIMCQAAEDLGFDNDICGYARISLAYAAGKRASRKFDPETLEFIIDPSCAAPHLLHQYAAGRHRHQKSSVSHGAFQRQCDAGCLHPYGLQCRKACLRPGSRKPLTLSGKCGICQVGGHTPISTPFAPKAMQTCVDLGGF